jgi:hypothetical protein
MLNSSSDQTIAKTDIQHTLFIGKEELIRFKLFGFYYSIQIDASEKRLIYRDGLLYKQLGPGPHRWWSILPWRKWKQQRINMRIEVIPVRVKGRVRGPSMPKDIPGAAAVDLACDVTADIDLVCKLADVKAHLQHHEPLTVFISTISDMIVEMIGKLPYDKYGTWITQLRDDILNQLTGSGRGNVERSVGIRVEDVLVTSFQPNTEHDRNMIKNYELVERVRREMAETQAKAERDDVAAKSFREQGELLNIAPSILALKDSSIGVALIENDANLRKLSIAAGLNPGVNIQPIQEPVNQLGSGSGIITGYLNLPQPGQRPGQNTPPPAAQQTSGPLPYQHTSSPSYPPIQQTSGVQYPGSQQQPSAPLNFAEDTTQTLTDQTQNASSVSSPVDPARQRRELAALQQNGFETGGEGKVTTVYDQNSNPIPNTTEWVLQVAAPRPNGYLTMVFHCPTGYPTVAPSVQLRNPTGGFRWFEPNTIQDWHIGRMLVEVAQEINNDIP